MQKALDLNNVIWVALLNFIEFLYCDSKVKLDILNKNSAVYLNSKP